MCGEQVAEVEKSGAADMIDQLDQLSAQEETLDSDIRRTQDTDCREKCRHYRAGITVGQGAGGPEIFGPSQ